MVNEYAGTNSAAAECKNAPTYSVKAPLQLQCLQMALAALAEGG